MAKITTITNPLTGQPAQVDQLDHTAQQIDDGLNIARGVSNPNLLDNWYFGNPVNQRGQTEYTGEVYTIDRWIAQWTGDGVTTIGDGFVSIYRAGWESSLCQRLKIDGYLKGKTVTLSVLAKGSFNANAVKVRNDWTEIAVVAGTPSVVSGSYAVPSATFDVPEDADYLVIQLVSTRGIASQFKAAKLELGDTQTLAHQDESGNWHLNALPNYADTLARCQLYRRQFNAYSKFVAQYIDANKVVFVLPVSMRTAPSMSGTWRIYTGFTEQTGFTLNTYQTGNIIVIEAVKENHGLSSAWLGVDSSGVGILNAEL